MAQAAEAFVNDGPVFTIGEFLERNKLSKTTFFKLRKVGLGPRMMLGRITPQSERDWRELMEREALSKKSQLEAARRVELATQAARAAAASPHHISKRPAGQRPKSKRAG